MPRKPAIKRQRVLAMNTAGVMTYCTAAPEMRGVGRCNHIVHQEENEDIEDFVKRANEALENSDATAPKDSIASKKPAFDFSDGDIEYETKPYRMTDEEKFNGVEIFGKSQLNEDFGDKDLYIHFEEPLWNNMDINYYAQENGLHRKNVMSVIMGEMDIVTESEDESFPVGTIPTPFRVSKIKERQEETINIMMEDWLKVNGEASEEEKAAKRAELEMMSPIKFGTGVEAMNIAAKANGFTATTDAAVLPYNMRPSTDLVNHPLTTAYTYLLNRRRIPQNQQLAYLALVNNNDDKTGYQRIIGGFQLKSIADEFAGKSGVFRKYMSGRAIPYSGRGVIDPSEDIEYGQAGIPATMAIDIFRPTLYRQYKAEGLSDKDFEDWVNVFKDSQDNGVASGEIEVAGGMKVTSVEERNARSVVYNNALNELQRRISSDKNLRVLLNRQPSSHTSNLQSFEPKVLGVTKRSDGSIGKNPVIFVNPLICVPTGGDFDGDQVTAYGVNSAGKNLAKSVDDALDAKNPWNSNLPRHLEESQIKPEKDMLFGVLSVLRQRSK